MTRPIQLKQQTGDDEGYSSRTLDQPVSMRAQKIAKLKNKKYRDAFVASQISVGLPFQIRALREQRGWKQSTLAAKAEMLQPRISAMESPGSAKFNLETLRRIASAFDVALVVRFVPFSELVDWSDNFDPDSFEVPEFEKDSDLKEPIKSTIQDFNSYAHAIRLRADVVNTWRSESTATSIMGFVDEVQVPMEFSAFSPLSSMVGVAR